MSKQRIIGIVGTRAAEVLPDLADRPFADEDRMQELDSLLLAIARVEFFAPHNMRELADLLLRKPQSA